MLFSKLAKTQIFLQIELQQLMLSWEVLSLSDCPGLSALTLDSDFAGPGSVS